MSDISTILADDAVGARNTIAQLLALEPDIEVLGEYGDGHTALAAVRETDGQDRLAAARIATTRGWL